MHIPPYWAIARLRHETGIRHGITVQRWGWSDISEEDAQRHAQQRALHALNEHIQASTQPQEVKDDEVVRIEPRTEYGLNGEGTPIREEVLERRDTIVMTRNSYGAHCLNTDNVAIADIDYPLPLKQQRRFPFLSFLLSLPSVYAFVFSEFSITPAGYVLLGIIPLVFLRNFVKWVQSRPQQPTLKLTPLVQALAKVYALSEKHPDWGLRVYETPKGLRVIVTHATWSVDAPQVQELFNALDVDPLYASLCRRQQCFRARVSGKPWRMQLSSLSALSRQWPTPARAQNSRAQWVSQYEQVNSAFAACHMIEHFGQQHPMPAQVRTLVEWHDQQSKALTPLPLA